MSKLKEKGPWKLKEWLWGIESFQGSGCGGFLRKTLLYGTTYFEIYGPHSYWCDANVIVMWSH